jgi:hypothetical protein
MFRKSIIFFLLSALAFHGKAQTGGYEEVNNKSFALYEKGAWTELLTYGKEAVRNGQDFLYLRLRLGYAAFKMANYGEALRQYEAALHQDSHNEAAHEYVRLCRIFLNQPSMADAERPRLSDAAKKEAGKSFAVTDAGLETSYKTTDVLQRQDALYTRVELRARLGWKWSTRQAVAYYGQNISATQYSSVKNNNNIQIGQWEYYGQLSRALGRHFEAKGAYHFLYTPFNNYIYNNHVGQLALKYYGSNWEAQVAGSYARLTDSTLQQFDAQMTWYPMGNLNMYIIGSATWNSTDNGYSCGHAVVGGRVWKNLWLEGNITLGSFRNLIENDAVYVYHAIDANRSKMGATAYYTFGRILLHAGYTYEARLLAGHNNYIFHQHSITGGLSWKF